LPVKHFFIIAMRTSVAPLLFPSVFDLSPSDDPLVRLDCHGQLFEDVFDAPRDLPRLFFTQAGVFAFLPEQSQVCPGVAFDFPGQLFHLPQDLLARFFDPGRRAHALIAIACLFISPGNSADPEACGCAGRAGGCTRPLS
jgi:hypothetical protein